MPTAEKIQEWKQRVDESKGQLTFLPEKLLAKAKKVEDLRKAFNEKVRVMSKDEIELRVLQENLLLDIRHELDTVDPENWTKNIAILEEAVKDDVYLVHLVEPQRR